MKAQFILAWPIVKAKEGDVVTDDPTDLGGYSVYGIASKHWPNEPVILAAKKLFLKAKDIVPASLVPMCQAYYEREWWNKLRLNELNEQEIANKIFDTAINVGSPAAVKFAQEAAGVTLTGHMDDATINALNS